jgi:hypothetical protein
VGAGASSESLRCVLRARPEAGGGRVPSLFLDNPSWWCVCGVALSKIEEITATGAATRERIFFLPLRRYLLRAALPAALLLAAHAHRRSTA